jgi:hypothetical protein
MPATSAGMTSQRLWLLVLDPHGEERGYTRASRTMRPQHAYRSSPGDAENCSVRSRSIMSTTVSIGAVSS